MSDESASGVHEPNESRTVDAPVSEWMRWNDIAISVDALSPPLDVGDACSTAPQPQQESSGVR